MSTITKKNLKPIVLSPDTVEAIEKILALDETAKLTLTKNGIIVYRERLKKEYSQS